MKKKLIVFSYDLNIGGIENALINLLNEIDYSKYDVELVLEKNKGINKNKVNKNVLVKEYRLSTCKIVIIRKLINLIKRCFWSIKNKGKYEVSIAYATYSLMGCKLSKIASNNSIMYVHSDYTNLYDSKAFKDFYDKREVSKFNKIVFVSNESKENFIKYYNDLKDKCYVLNNFVDYKSIIKLSKETIDYKKNNEKLLVFVGRLDESSKKVSRLLYAMKRIKEKDVKAKCLIVGDGPNKEEYIKYINDNDLNDIVSLIGSKNNPYPYMLLADYIILTSEYEGYPLVYQEAITLNKKIITTIDVSDETFSINGRYGYVVSKDKDELTNQIINILKHDNLALEKVDMDLVNKCKKQMLNKILGE